VPALRPLESGTHLSTGFPIAALNIGFQAYALRQSNVRLNRVVHRVAAVRSPTGGELVVRRMHLHDAVLTATEDGDIGVRLPTPVLMHPWKRPACGGTPPAATPFDVTGDEARRLLARSMTDYNSGGAKQQDVDAALAAIAAAGGSDAFARSVAGSGAAITRTNRLHPTRRGPSNTPSLRQVLGTFRGEVIPVRKYRDPFDRDERPKLDRIEALALEMALSEEAERRALEGELAGLAAAWREAEEIARIADALPDHEHGSNGVDRDG
jgi:hypothetical protein